MKIAIHGRTFQEAARPFVQSMFDTLRAREAEVQLSDTYRQFLDSAGVSHHSERTYRNPQEIFEADFAFSLGGDGTLRALGKCMDVSAAGTSNGTPIQIYDCNGTGAQRWQANADGTLRNPVSNKCLDASGNSSANGTRLQIWECFAGTNQRWTLP